MPGQFQASKLNLFPPFYTFRLQQIPQFCKNSYQKVILLLNVKRMLQQVGTAPNLSKMKRKKSVQMHVGFSWKSVFGAWHSWKTHCNKPPPNAEDTLSTNQLSTTSIHSKKILTINSTTFYPFSALLNTGSLPPVKIYLFLPIFQISKKEKAS